MSTTRPGLYPLHDLLGTNFIAPENSLFLQSGYPVNLPVPSADHNGKFNRSGLWHQYLDLNGIRNADWLDIGATQTLSSTTLAYNIGGNVLTTGATVLTRGVHLVGGTRIETDAAFLNPVGGVQGNPLIYPGSITPGRIWVYASSTGVVRYDSVAAGVVDSPAAGEVTLVGLRVDALGDVVDGALAPAIPLPAQQLSVEIPVALLFLLLQDIGTVLEIIGGGVTGGDPAVTIDSGIGPALTVQSTSPTDSAVTIASVLGGAALRLIGGSGRALWADVDGSDAGVRVEHLGSGAGVQIFHLGSGVGLLVDSSISTGAAIDAVGPSGGDVVVSTCDTGSAFRATATSSGFGVNATGGNSVSSVAVRGESTHVNANAIDGFTDAAATTAAAGVRGIGLGDGIGVHGQSNGGAGYAIVATADTTAPTRAAMRLIPQNADPTTGDQGALLFNSARGAGGKLRYFTSAWESAHSSPRGWVKQWGAAAAGGPIAGGSGNLSLCSISPEQTGDVLVSATGSLEFSADNGSCTVTLVDVTGGVNVATQVERAIDTDAVAPNVRSFAIRGIRALPSTATRSFAVVITANTGTITYANVVCLVEGVQ